MHALSRRGDPGYLPELSRRQGRHVYRHGFSPRKRFAFTVGNTITNARDIEDESRRKLIERHEGLHVWQQRWFGPLFPLVYGLWMVGGALTGSVAWLFHRDREAWAVVVERHAYYYNPFEHWAYAADHDWPPLAWIRLAMPPNGPSTLAPAVDDRTATRSVDRERERVQAAQHDAAVPLRLVGRELEGRGSGAPGG